MTSSRKNNRKLYVTLLLILIILSALFIISYYSNYKHLNCSSPFIEKRIEFILIKKLNHDWRQPEKYNFLEVNFKDINKNMVIENNHEICSGFINYKIRSDYLSGYNSLEKNLKKIGIHFIDLNNKTFTLAGQKNIINRFVISYKEKRGGYYPDLGEFNLDPLVLNFNESSFKKMDSLITAILSNLNSKKELNFEGFTKQLNIKLTKPRESRTMNIHSQNRIIKYIKFKDNVYYLTVSEKGNFVQIKLFSPLFSNFLNKSFTKNVKYDNLHGLFFEFTFRTYLQDSIIE